VGLIALDAFARSAPDGYTVMVGNTNSNFLAPNAYKSKLTIDPAKTILIVTRIGFNPYLFLRDQDRVPGEDVQEFLAYAKANPGKTRYTSAALGATPTMISSPCSSVFGLNMMHIPPEKRAALRCLRR